jgi:hypothetical protein
VDVDRSSQQVEIGAGEGQQLPGSQAGVSGGVDERPVVGEERVVGEGLDLLGREEEHRSVGSARRPDALRRVGVDEAESDGRVQARPERREDVADRAGAEIVGLESGEKDSIRAGVRLLSLVEPNSGSR